MCVLGCVHASVPVCSRCMHWRDPCREISYYVAKPSWSKTPESDKHPGMIQLLHVSRARDCSCGNFWHLVRFQLLHLHFWRPSAQNLSGMVRPGELTCLMGASGAGKLSTAFPQCFYAACTCKQGGSCGVCNAHMLRPCTGKTTLMDVVAGRKTQGIIEGEIRLNGHIKNDGVWRRISACELWCYQLAGVDFRFEGSMCIASLPFMVLLQMWSKLTFTQKR